MEKDEQREREALEAIATIETLVENARAIAQARQAQIVAAWEAHYTLEQHVALVATTLIDAAQMKKIDMFHVVTKETERKGHEYAQALSFRLGGDRERLEQLLSEAMEREHERRAKQPANTRYPAHAVYPKTWTFRYQDKEYTFVPECREHAQLSTFLGNYHVTCEGEKVGHLHYFSGTERWQVPNHSQKKDIKKAFADFLDWQKNPRRRK